MAEPQIFSRIVCGVDGTEESLVAVRHATRLLERGGSVQLTAVANLAQAAQAGAAAQHAAEQLQEDAETALADARAIAPAATEKLVDGEPVAALLREIESTGATLVAIGTHGHGRTAGMLLGSTAARILRDAPCSVLVAREARDREAWPASLAAGVDGSPESAAAFAVASSIAERFGAGLQAVASTKDQFDREAARGITSELEEHDERAVGVLVAASQSADLIVVGSRGLHGLKALGSVSERVAHQAQSSVLVVRAP